jgi:hypothetical protein
VVSGDTTDTEELKITRPTCAWPGSLSISVWPARTAACMRVGWTSLAAIDPETSTTRITLVWSLGTRRVACGRASASSRPKMPNRKRAAGR